MTDREKLRLWLDAVESGLCADCELVAVVRCKDCRFWSTWDTGEYFCGRLEGGIGGSANDFCSYGERIEK